MPIYISIIIVNYNVKAFLEQCLYAVLNSSKGLNSEVIVVDNNSVDDSVEMLKTNFPNVQLICNVENKGFAYACNQGLKISKGKYALLLNPDTIIREDSLLLCNNFMEKHPDAGALGVKMIDGKGKFLPESKRSVPTASSAFYKIFGLSAIFPKSKIFGKYQLKYLDENKVHEVEALSGAFMFLRKEVIDKIGLLDEDYFMYGEDIDLSYRILKAGYKNYYFPLTTIIHFKGESTRKASIRYVKLFYNAMLIFSKKHYKSGYSKIFRLIISLAIYLRAAISLINRLIKSIYIPAFDFLLTYLVYSGLVPVWEKYRYMGFRAYSNTHTQIYIFVYIIIWIIFVGYYTDFKPFIKLNKLLKAVFWGTIFILAGYSLLPEQYRFSRAIILIGSLVFCLVILFNRLIIRLIIGRGRAFTYKRKKTALVVGNNTNKTPIDYPEYLNVEFEIKKTINLKYNNEKDSLKINQLMEIIDIYKIETIIFFIKDLPVSDLIKIIIQTRNRNLEFKMILPLSHSMVGSQSVINLDTLPDFRLNPVSDIKNKIKKRFLDLFVSIIFLILFPLFIHRNKFKVIFSILTAVIFNKLTWVSYVNYKKEKYQELPKLKPGILSPLILIKTGENEDIKRYEANLNYAKNYKMIIDFEIILKSLQHSLDFEYHLKSAGRS
jgi:O-antigen biosynthesis protein